MGPRVTFALKAFADVDKFEFPIRSLIGTSREKSTPKPAQVENLIEIGIPSKYKLR